jgi:hypothetical protein
VGKSVQAYRDGFGGGVVIASAASRAGADDVEEAGKELEVGTKH